ncbi:MAG: hypothetical protein ACYDCN_08490 [Bacteroidia bacterium]
MAPETIEKEIPRRMCELRHGDNYFRKFRHFSLAPAETRKVKGYTSYFFLVGDVSDINISSTAGDYDLGDAGIREQQHEHTGKLILTNQTKAILQVQFVQVIPKND